MQEPEFTQEDAQMAAKFCAFVDEATVTMKIKDALELHNCVMWLNDKFFARIHEALNPGVPAPGKIRSIEVRPLADKPEPVEASDGQHSEE